MKKRSFTSLIFDYLESMRARSPLLTFLHGMSFLIALPCFIAMSLTAFENYPEFESLLIYEGVLKKVDYCTARKGCLRSHITITTKDGDLSFISNFGKNEAPPIAALVGKPVILGSKDRSLWLIVNFEKNPVKHLVVDGKTFLDYRDVKRRHDEYEWVFRYIWLVSGVIVAINIIVARSEMQKIKSF